MFYRYSIFRAYDLDIFTTTNDGGVSGDTYSSLNLCTHSGDNISNVARNRQILANSIALEPDSLFIPYQTHEDKIKIIDEGFLNQSNKEQADMLYGVDSLITQQKGVCIGVTTADCVPVSIYDPMNHVLGVAHAGWKGTIARIGAKTVQRMISSYSSNPTDLLIAIGPSISQEKFEVGDEVGDAFTNADFDLDRISYRNSNTGKLHIDLWQANKQAMLEIGINENKIEVSGICSYRSNQFFSARRQGLKSGRMFTGGVLK